MPVSKWPPMFSCRRNRAEAARRAVYRCSVGLNNPGKALKKILVNPCEDKTSSRS